MHVRASTLSAVLVLKFFKVHPSRRSLAAWYDFGAVISRCPFSSAISYGRLLRKGAGKRCLARELVFDSSPHIPSLALPQQIANLSGRCDDVAGGDKRRNGRGGTCRNAADADAAEDGLLVPQNKQGNKMAQLSVVMAQLLWLNYL